MEASDNRKARRSRLLKRHKAEIESESIGLNVYRKMRLARLLDRTQTFCDSGRRRRTGPALILEPGLFIQRRTKNGRIILETSLFAQRRTKNGRIILETSLFAQNI